MTKVGNTLRMVLVALVFAGAFSGLGAKLVWLHLGEHPEEKAIIHNTIRTELTLEGVRGRILDSTGELLALDVEVKHVAVDPSFLHAHGNVEATAVRLAYLLELDPARVRALLANKERRFVYLKKYVPYDTARAIERLKIRGVITENDMHRHYPKGPLMSHVVGFSNLNGEGSLGVEQTMNHYLVGRSGLRVGTKNGRRAELRDRRELDIAPEMGGQIQLTINQHLQYVVEESLRHAMEEHQAIGAWAVVMETRTGRVLAMASKPDFNLNEYRETQPEQLRNRALAMVYEPGSIMKPITMAIALEEGVTHRDEVIDCENGTWFYLGRPLRDYHAYDKLSVWDVLRKSSNIGTAKIAIRVPETRFHDYLQRFGFGAAGGIELPGEERGILHAPRKWSKLDLSRICIGHSVSVTQLQMVNAINAIANEGFLMRPYVVERVTDSAGRVVQASEPEVLARPISGATALKVREMMARIVAPGGTGRRAAPSDTRYHAGGKTGTAEKLVNGRYDSRKNIASFVGFLPVDRPAITIAVSVDEPKVLRTGGVVAGPVFKQIADEAVKILTITPDGPAGPDLEPTVRREETESVSRDG